MLERLEDVAQRLEELNRLLIHEFGHHYSGNHLDSKYHDALCRLGAKLARLAVESPDLFRPMER